MMQSVLTLKVKSLILKLRQGIHPLTEDAVNTNYHGGAIDKRPDPVLTARK